MEKDRIGWGYKLTKAYFRFAAYGIYYRAYHCLGRDNIPQPGTPVLVAMNHQNAFCDALGVLMSKDDRKWHFIARADAFDIHPLFGKFITWAGVLPAYRLQYQGEEALAGNDETFRLSEEGLLKGNSILIFPEAGHQDKHWLGTFSYGYTRMAFQAAEKGNFEKEIFILPAANHYSEYTGMRQSMLIRFGTPVSIKPYYELYKTKPRTAQREVNKLVRSQIESMMLDIRDLDHYADIDFLRGCLHNADAPLPEQLEADKALVKRLQALQETDPSAYQEAMDNVKTYRLGLAAAGLEDRQIKENPNWFLTLLQALVLLALAPLALLALWPSVPAWYIPKHFSDKTGDIMLQSSIVLAANTLLLMPLFCVITFVVTTLLAGWEIGLFHAILMPFLCIFEHHYLNLFRTVRQAFRFLTGNSKDSLAALRSKIVSL